MVSLDSCGLTRAMDRVYDYLLDHPGHILTLSTSGACGGSSIAHLYHRRTVLVLYRASGGDCMMVSFQTRLQLIKRLEEKGKEMHC